MRLSHFHAFGPVCPICRPKEDVIALDVREIDEDRDGDVLSGILACDNCGTRYPILDGLPILVPNLARFVSENLFYLTMRRDLAPGVAALLAEASGPGAGLDVISQHVSSYGWDHWSDQDPAEGGGELVSSGQIVNLLRAGLNGLPAIPSEGPVLDVGCGAGRSVAELARWSGRPVLGIDMSVPLARLARSAVVEGTVAYDRRRNGAAFEARRFAVAANPLADVWIADAAALPFASNRLALVAAFNLLDCVISPRDVLTEFGRVLRRGGPCVIATPFDWSIAATPFPAWLGGRSASDTEGGGAEAALDRLLSDGPDAAGSLRRSRPSEDVEWNVRLHDRAAMSYLSHLVWSAKTVGGATE